MCDKFLMLVVGLVILIAVPQVVSGQTPPEFVLAWGERGTEGGQFREPSGITIDSKGNVYIGDTSNHRIQKFDKDGQFILQWGSIGRENGQFWRPRGVTVDSQDNVYVADYLNHRIQKFTENGAFLLSWGTSCITSESDPNCVGEGDGQFFEPSDVAVDSYDNVYVVDSWNRRIQVFDAEGNFLMKWGTYGFAPGEFELPESITIDSNGVVYVTDIYRAFVHKFSSEGEYISGWDTPNTELYGLRGIDVDEAGNVYVSNSYRIQQFDANGTFVLEWGTQGEGQGQFADPEGLAVDSAGSVYVADRLNYRVQKFAWSSVPVRSTTWGRLKAHYR